MPSPEEPGRRGGTPATDRRRVAVAIRVVGGKAGPYIAIDGRASVADLTKAPQASGPRILINNAGRSRTAPIAKTRLED